MLDIVVVAWFLILHSVDNWFIVRAMRYAISIVGVEQAAMCDGFLAYRVCITLFINDCAYLIKVQFEWGDLG